MSLCRLRQSAPTLARAALLGVVALLLPACGYSHHEVFPDQYQTVAAPIFENRTFYRGVEFDLTEALVKEIEGRTPYKVVQRPRAGTELVGTILRVDQELLSRSREAGVPQEVEVTILVNWTWKDVRTGQVIRDRQGFLSAGRYAPQRPVGQPYEIAQHQAVERLAEDIVTTMQADW